MFLLNEIIFRLLKVLVVAHWVVSWSKTVKRKTNKFKLFSFFWTAYHCHSVSFLKSLRERFGRFVWATEIFLVICIDSLKCKLVSL